jgi:hypothetical protein
MSILFTVQKRKNPGNPSALERFYLISKIRGHKKHKNVLEDAARNITSSPKEVDLSVSVGKIRQKYDYSELEQKTLKFKRYGQIYLLQFAGYIFQDCTVADSLFFCRQKLHDITGKQRAQTCFYLFAAKDGTISRRKTERRCQNFRTYRKIMHHQSQLCVSD